MKLISYVLNDGLSYTQATDLALMELYMHMAKNYGTRFAITFVHEMSQDDFKRWQILGGSVLFKREINAG